MDIPRIDVKFIFRDGGHSDFQAKYEWLKERLHHAQELGMIPGQNLEPPPPYDANAPEASSATVGRDVPSGGTAGPSGATATTTSSQHQPPQPAPDEPPPDYLEAQAQAVAIQYEERERGEAERR